MTVSFETLMQGFLQMIFSKRTVGIAGGLTLALVACQSGPSVSSPGLAGPETIGATVAKLTNEAAALPPLLRTRWAV